MPDLGRNKTITLNANLALSGAQFRVMIQDVVTTNYSKGVDLTTIADTADNALEYDNGAGALSAGSSNLRINGVYRKFTEVIAVSSGQAVILQLAQTDFSRCAPGNGLRYVVILVGNAGGTTWTVGASWLLDVDLTATRLWARTTRLPDGRLAVYVRTEEENTDDVRINYDSSSVTIPWSGARHAGTGMKAFYAELPAVNTVISITATATDSSGNSATINLQPPAPNPASSLPKPLPAWNLPSWLPITGELSSFIAAINSSLPDTRGAGEALNPALATGDTLDVHAALHGATRGSLEPDAALRGRVLAVIRGTYLTRAALEPHLSSVAGSRVVITDNTYTRAGVTPKLDGSRRLDGSWQLGGAGGTLGAATYLVSLTEPLDAPLERVISELHRLRPMGLLPIIEHRTDAVIALFPRLAGVSRNT